VRSGRLLSCSLGFHRWLCLKDMACQVKSTLLRLSSSSNKASACCCSSMPRLLGLQAGHGRLRPVWHRHAPHRQRLLSTAASSHSNGGGGAVGFPGGMPSPASPLGLNTVGQQQQLPQQVCRCDMALSAAFLCLWRWATLALLVQLQSLLTI
jgi:hypothetical protein